MQKIRQKKVLLEQEKDEEKYSAVNLHEANAHFECIRAAVAELKIYLSRGLAGTHAGGLNLAWSTRVFRTLIGPF